MRYYHGSSIALAVGTRMVGRGAVYEKAWANTDFYSVLERYRPDTHPRHQDVVFMVGDPDDIDLAGGATDWCFELKAEGPVTRHDLNWSSEISCLISEGNSPDDVAVRDAAIAYWSGLPHPNESVWEYITPAASVVRCAPYASFQV